MQDFYSLTPLLKPESKHIYPIFIPFAGCKKRCAFCAQTLQTGQQEAELEQIEKRLKTSLGADCATRQKKQELAFFGGTFTLMPEYWQKRFLELGKVSNAAHQLHQLRCSTRPDAVSHSQLSLLREYGLKTIELGIQSYDSCSLQASGRGYTGQTAFEACSRVSENGFNLVIQLMPGMPGQTIEAFRKDIELVLELKPQAVRLYPCLVIAETELAKLWQSGSYQPWSIEQTISELAAALLKLNLAGIPVIRQGLAPEAELTSNILAGPWHPALGNIIQAKALYLWLSAKLGNLPASIVQIHLPRWLQGIFWGHKGELKPAYEELLITRDKVIFWEWPIVKFTVSGYN